MPPSPQKIPLQGLHASSRHCCLPLWLPGHPIYSATQVKSPCQGLQHCMVAHTGTGWTGRTLARHRHCSNAQSNQGIVNPHGYTKLCHGARQEQEDKCLNVAVSTFVLTRTKIKQVQNLPGILVLLFTVCFPEYSKNEVDSGNFQGQLLCQFAIRQLFLWFKT